MKQMIMVTLLALILTQTANLYSVITPIPMQQEKKNPLQVAAIKNGLGDPGEKILTAVAIASKQTGISQELLLSLMYSESSFNVKAVSSKNYQGLMQIPQKVHYEDANTLIGAKILIEKLAIAKGDMKTALILYKGWKVSDSKGQQKANSVLALAKKLKEG